MSNKIFGLIALIIFVFGLQNQAKAQFGISLKHAFDYEDIPNTTPNQPNERLLQYGGVIALDYRIKMVNYGVLFGPEIMAKMIRAKGIAIIDENSTEQIAEADQLRSFGINIPVTIYPFHFDQCDECPSFKKKHFFTNAFFLQPVVGYEMRNWTTDPADVIEDITEHFIVAGFGVGVDIKAGQIIRISPMVQYKQNFALNENTHYKTKLKPSILEVGIRVGWGR